MSNRSVSWYLNYNSVDLQIRVGNFFFRVKPIALQVIRMAMIPACRLCGVLVCVLACSLAPQPAAANLLCSGDDPTCITPLYDSAFFAELNASSFYTDYLGETSNPIDVNGVRVVAQTMNNMPLVQLPQVDTVQLLVTVPSGGMVRLVFF